MNDIVIIDTSIPLIDLKELAKKTYNTMIKGVVDIEKEIVAFGGDYHIVANMKLIENGSEQKNIWGFNVEFDQENGYSIEYISLINIRPLANNRNMEVQDENLRQKMKLIIDSKIT